MDGYVFVIGGDPAQGRDMVLLVLRELGFAVEALGEWAARARRDSWLGARLKGTRSGGESARMRLDVGCAFDDAGNLVVTMRQEREIDLLDMVGLSIVDYRYELASYGEVYKALYDRLGEEGVLVTSHPVWWEIWRMI